MSLGVTVTPEIDIVETENRKQLYLGLHDRLQLDNKIQSV